MSSKEIETIKNTLVNLTTEELLQIWIRNNSDEWKPEAFVAVKQLLSERNVFIPQQQIDKSCPDRAKHDGMPFFPTSALKLFFLSIFSYNLYQIYWMYKNISFFKRYYGFEIKPIGRAIFWPLFYYDMTSTVKEFAVQNGISVRFSPGLLTLALYTYFILPIFFKDFLLLHMIYIMIYVALGSLFLIPIQRTINRVQKAIYFDEHAFKILTFAEVFILLVPNMAFALVIMLT